MGRGAGVVSLPETLTAAETCQPIEQNSPAGIVLSGPELPITENRQIVAMQDCGGNMLHWRWTAPAADIGPVFFAGGVVAPDKHMDAAGDRVTRLFKTIGSPAQARYEAALTGGCSVQRIGRGTPELFACVIALAALRRRRLRHE
jgi:hypothetical protein